MNTKKCPIKNLFSEISKMWVMSIIREIYLWNTSFNKIKKELWNISSKTLSERLKELQDFWFVERNIVSNQPIKIEYKLTKKWTSFSKEVENLNTWAKWWWY